MPHALLPAGHRLFYELHGPVTGPRVVFIMGLSGNATAWQPQLLYFAREFRCLVFDNRGAGRSDVGSGRYTTSLMAQDTKARGAPLRGCGGVGQDTGGLSVGTPREGRGPHQARVPFAPFAATLLPAWRHGACPRSCWTTSAGTRPARCI